MDPIAPLLITKALDGLAMRQLATAENISNANSAGFRPLRVAFEDQLKAAAGAGADTIRQVRPRIEAEALPQAAEMRLDLELATASATSMRYAALLDILSRQIQISRLAIRGGQ